MMADVSWQAVCMFSTEDVRFGGGRSKERFVQRQASSLKLEKAKTEATKHVAGVLEIRSF
jgi:hypothetical protein